MQKKASLNYCIRIKEETLESIKQIAEAKKRPTSQMIRVILEDYIEKVSL